MRFKSIAIILVVVALSATALPSVYSIAGRDKKEIHADRDTLVKNLKNEFESKPNNKTLDERLAAGQKFKDEYKKLCEEEAEQGLDTPNEQDIFINSIQEIKDLLKPLIRSYEYDKSYLESPGNKKDYDIAKKKLEFVEKLEYDYNNGKISAKDANVRFLKIKDIN